MNSKNSVLKNLFIVLFLIQLIDSSKSATKKHRKLVDATANPAGSTTPAPTDTTTPNTANNNTTGIVATEGTEPPKCNQKLIVALGLEGFAKAKPVKDDKPFPMCKSIKNTCCRHSDQLSIYNNWVVNNEEELLNQLLRKHAFVYDSYVDLSIQIKERAKMIFDLEKSNKNCKLMAKKLLEFEIDKIGSSIKDTTKAMHTYFKESHKGFYCAVCDANNQKFIDMRGHKFVYNEKFCRSIIANSLKFLLYFHIYANKYNELQKQFLSSCTNRGKYKSVTIRNAPTFGIDEVAVSKIMACRKHEKEEFWMDHCGDICSSFQVTKYNDFFAPNINKYNRFNRFVARKLLKYKRIAQKQAEKDAKKAEAGKPGDKGAPQATNGGTAPAPGGTTPPPGRRLAEAGATPAPAPAPAAGQPADPKAPKADAPAEAPLMTVDELENLLIEIYKFDRNPPIIRASIGTDLNIEHFSSRYKEEGIDLFDYGVNTDISDASLVTIKNLEELEDEKRAAVAITASGMAANAQRVLLGLWTGLFICLIALLTK